ncbi:hypothetical protein TNCV_4357241 [Trichonephila clavipes]|nr:hypothetical protein TNCV_4357241 [Trichonephila clavipes]
MGQALGVEKHPDKCKPREQPRGQSIGLQIGRPGFDARCHEIPFEYTRITSWLNQWDESRVQGTGEYFPTPSVPRLNCGGRIRGVTIYRPFVNFSELNRTVICMEIKAKANDRYTSSPFPQRIPWASL